MPRSRPTRRVRYQFRPLLLGLETRIIPSFVAARAFDAGFPYPFFETVGDFNGDGILDLVVTTNSTFTGDNTAGMTVLLGNGDGSFQAPRALTAGTGVRSVAVGDFNGDGKLDLVTTNFAQDCDYFSCTVIESDVRVLLGNGDGSFQAPRGFAAGTQPRSIAVGDFNGDGIPDLAVADDFNSNVNVLLGAGDGSFQAPRTFAAGGSPWSVLVGDFNGDGALDLAIGSSSVLLGNGDGSFQAPRAFATGPYASSVAAGDFNGDGILQAIRKEIS